MFEIRLKRLVPFSNFSFLNLKKNVGCQRHFSDGMVWIDAKGMRKTIKSK